MVHERGGESTKTRGDSIAVRTLVSVPWIAEYATMGPRLGKAFVGDECAQDPWDPVDLVYVRSGEHLRHKSNSGWQGHVQLVTQGPCPSTAPSWDSWMVRNNRQSGKDLKHRWHNHFPGWVLSSYSC